MTDSMFVDLVYREGHGTDTHGFLNTFRYQELTLGASAGRSKSEKASNSMCFHLRWVYEYAPLDGISYAWSLADWEAYDAD